MTLIEVVMPYMVRNRQSNRNNRRMEDDDAASELAVAPPEVLRSRLVDGEMWYFTRKRMLGAARPTLTDVELEFYLSIKAKEVWNYADFVMYSGVRMFNVQTCTCSSNSQWLTCYHTKALRFRNGT